MRERGRAPDTLRQPSAAAFRAPEKGMGVGDQRGEDPPKYPLARSKQKMRYINMAEVVAKFLPHAVTGFTGRRIPQSGTKVIRNDTTVTPE